MSDAFTKWAEFYQRMAAAGTEQLWPSETLIRLLRGRYVPGMPKDLRGLKVLDVGCGNGNNAVFLCAAGMQVAVTEVDAAICDLVRERMRRLGYEVDAKVGANRSLPFASDTFDFIVSWNVIHYEASEAEIRAAFAEHARVLKPGGRLLLSTTGPDHRILQGHTRLGPHRYQIGRADDFRKGQVFYYFDDEASLREHLAPSFADVQIGRVHDHLMTETLDAFVACATKAGPAARGA